MDSISIPIAKAIGAEAIGAEEPSLLDSLKHLHGNLCENIKLQRENYCDFCEDEYERDNTLEPIEQDPESYSNGTIKTRPILKKYAKTLCEKLDLEARIEATEELLRDTDLTPQQVKVDMKRYVAISEKKIASQQEQIDKLNDKMEQMCKAIALIASPVASSSDDDSGDSKKRGRPKKVKPITVGSGSDDMIANLVAAAHLSERKNVVEPKTAT